MTPKIVSLIELPPEVSRVLTQNGFTVHVVPTVRDFQEMKIPSHRVVLCGSSACIHSKGEVRKVLENCDPASTFWICVTKEGESFDDLCDIPFHETLRWPTSVQEISTRIGNGFRTLSLHEQLKEASRKSGVFRDKETGFVNPALLESILDYELQRSKRYCAALSCLVASLDTEASALSQELLERFYRLIQTTVRETDLVFPLDHSQLLILMPHTERVNALSFTERIRQKTNASETDAPSVSFGIAAYPNNPTTESHALIRCAQKALRQAQERGGNQASLYRENI